jgi:hypothetical protein
MAVDEKLDRLAWELSKQSLGPVDGFLSEITSRVSSATTTVISSLQKAANDQPLMTVILAVQAGYLVARLGRRYART